MLIDHRAQADVRCAQFLEHQLIGCINAPLDVVLDRELLGEHAERCHTLTVTFISTAANQRKAQGTPRACGALELGILLQETMYDTQLHLVLLFRPELCNAQ